MNITPLHTLGRMMTGGTYAVLGYGAARTPGGRTQMAAPMLAAIRQVVPLPQDDKTIVRLNGAAQALAGTTLALGIFPRFSAATLATSLVPTTLAGHAFWNIEDLAARQAQQVQFTKNMAMLGGLLTLAANDK